MVPHHPEARFAEPGSLQRHYAEIYRKCYGTPERAKIVIPPPVVRDVIEVATAKPDRPEENDVSALAIVRSIAKAHGYTVEQIRGARKGKAIVAARWEALRAVYEARPAWSLPQLGRFFCRDHTTILVALRKMGVRP